MFSESLESILDHLTDGLKLKVTPSQIIQILASSSKSSLSFNSLVESIKAQELRYLQSPSALFPFKTWKSLKLSKLPQGENLIRSHFSYLFFDSILFFYSGRCFSQKDETFLGKLDLLSRSVQMKPCKAGPGFRENSSMSLYNETLLLFGGFGTEYFNDLWAFDVNSEVWTQIATQGASPPGRAGCLSFTTGDYLFVFGGGDQERVFSDWFLLDLQGLVWTEDLDCEVHSDFLASRELMASCPVGRSVFVFGGRSSREELCSSFDLFIFDDFFRLKIKKLATGPPARASSSLCSVKEGVLALVGGLGVKGCLNDVWLYFYNDDRWVEFEGLNKVPARQGHCAVCYADELILFGGSNERKFVDRTLASLQIFYPNNRTSVQPELVSEINLKLVKLLYCFKENAKEKPCKPKKTLEAKPEALFYPIDLNAEQVNLVNSMFPDDFSALIHICRLWASFSIQIQLKGSVFYLSQKLCKLVPKTSFKKFVSKKRNSNDHDFHIRQNLLSSWSRSPGKQREILKLSIKPKSPEENFIDFLLKKDPSCFSAFFRFSPVFLMICKTENFSVALFEKEKNSFHYFYCQIDENLNIRKPARPFASAVLNNIVSRSHLKTPAEILSTGFLDLFLYTDKFRRTETGDIVDCKSRSLVNFMDIVEDLKVVVNKILCKKVMLNKQFLKHFCGFKVFLAAEKQFSVLMYHSSRLVFWEYKEQDSENCLIVEILDSSFINNLTGLVQQSKTQEILKLIKDS